MKRRLKILIVGGYGVFGGRLITLLEGEPDLVLLVAGRSVTKANAFIGSRTDATATLLPLAFDRSGDVESSLRSVRPDLLVDASGPFQNYGDDRYRLLEACIAEGVHYLDLADGSEFVAGVGTFDAKAKRAGVFVLSGVSSFPILTAAVVRRLSGGMSQITAIRGGIAPSPYAGVGENVIRAISAYAGQAVGRMRGGEVGKGHPFTEQIRYTVAPPGRLPLYNTMFSLVDVPDLRALPPLWPHAKDVWMGAGPVPEILHRMLVALSWLVRLRVLPTLSPMAPLMHFVMNHVRWGEHRGGMFVEIEGLDAMAKPLKRSWHLLAEGDDGPLIPSMAVEAIVRNVAVGRSPAPGARAATTDLELDDYEKLFASRTIYTGTRDDGPSDAPLYARILGDAWHSLPETIRQLHDLHGSLVFEGRARVTRGTSLWARLAAAIIGFPKTDPDVAVRVELEAINGREIWTRTFGKDRFRSVQYAGEGRSCHLLLEQFGALTFAMAPILADDRLSLTLRRWNFFGIPLPMWLCPRSDSYETVEDGRFRFHVDIQHPLTGPIVRYEGWLAGASREP
jgi:hypothetical protein